MSEPPPAVLFHGSATPNLPVLEPRRRFTPRAEHDQSPEGVYASDEPGYAVGHAFPWQSHERIDLAYQGDDGVHRTLTVPVSQRQRLDQPIVVSTVPAAPFQLLAHVTPVGRNYRALVSVWDAFTHFGGQIVIVPERCSTGDVEENDDAPASA